MTDPLYLKRAEVIEKDAEAAVKQLAAELTLPNMAGVIFFCSSHYDAETLSESLNFYFQCPVIGCTSAGEIGSCYQNGGIVAVSFSAEVFTLHPLMYNDLDHLQPTHIDAQLQNVRKQLTFSKDLDPQRMFAYMLIDGLSFKEELITDIVSTALGGIDLVGGSAGDELEFTQTRIFFEGRFHNYAAVIVLVETQLDFKTFKHQHVEPMDGDLVVTQSIPTQRQVIEINGGPAGEEYAKLVGVEFDELGPKVFSMHPLVLQINNDWHVRSIKKLNKDGSLTFSCAIDNGLPLTLGHSQGLVKTLRKQVDSIKKDFSRIDITLGCDCMLRRMELLAEDDTKHTEHLLNEINFTGFSSYGEQYNGVHINQTLVGVVLGKKSL